jgi:hypothetical protein
MVRVQVDRERDENQCENVQCADEGAEVLEEFTVRRG